MGMGFAPTWLRQVSPHPPASHDHFNHCVQAYLEVITLSDYNHISVAGLLYTNKALLRSATNRHLCDICQGFLIESKVLMLLAPLQRCEQTVMKLDAVFSVIKAALSSLY